jgi:hypothetical protein
MWVTLQSLVIPVIKLLVKPVVAFFIYLRGKKEGKLEVEKELYKEIVRKRNEEKAIEIRNALKSDADILDELRDEDTRGSP